MNVRKRLTALLGVLLCTVGPAAVALAAKGAKAPKNTGPPELKASVSFWAILCALVALAGVCVVAFKNARRTHLD